MVVESKSSACKCSRVIIIWVQTLACQMPYDKLFNLCDNQFQTLKMEMILPHGIISIKWWKEISKAPCRWQMLHKCASYHYSRSIVYVLEFKLFSYFRLYVCTVYYITPPTVSGKTSHNLSINISAGKKCLNIQKLSSCQFRSGFCAK